jgi:hypothetical protein
MSRTTKVNGSSKRVFPTTHLKVGIAAKNADPYPRPPPPVFDLREIRERVEGWQASVLSAPSPRQDSELIRSTHAGDGKQPSPLNFPMVKQRRSNVSRAMKRKASPSRKDHSTSRYFRGVADSKFPDPDGVNEGVTTSLFEPRGSNVEPTSHSRAEVLGEDTDTTRRGLPPSDTAAGQQNIQQVSEVW